MIYTKYFSASRVNNTSYDHVNIFYQGMVIDMHILYRTPFKGHRGVNGGHFMSHTEHDITLLRVPRLIVLCGRCRLSL